VGEVDFETKEIARNAQLARDYERLEIPLMIERLACAIDSESCSRALS